MKTSIQVLIISFFLNYSCGVIKKGGELNNKTLMITEKVIISDTLKELVQGKVIGLDPDFNDANGLEGVYIELSNNENSYLERSDKTGYFKFDNISFGKYQIQCSFVGYVALKDSILLKANENINLKIQLGYEW